MKRLVFLGVWLLLVSGPLYAADVIYVQSVKAKIMLEPNFRSRLMGYASRGDALQVMKSEGGWYKVSQKSVEGWVNFLLVANHPPLEKIRVITHGDADLTERSRKRISDFTSAAAARGLNEADRKNLSGAYPADYEALNRVINISKSVDPEDVEAFLSGEEKQ